ncbi:Protein-associating with the carboxyl-terminal domain of ezrin [Actinomortierella wolfii]|nr:Protein-associating with the carboxyl-terminal domain of ezrin [Actinomortierella wolfii]
MGASESKHTGDGAPPSSRSKLTFVPGAPPLCTTPIYTLRDAFYGKRPVSAFTYDPSQLNLGSHVKSEILPKAIKKLMTIRHPSVLRFIDCKTDSSGVHLITEQVRPLTIEHLEEIPRDEILLGLHDMLIALHFLHTQCQSRHNNIHLGSIFVSNGRWVLGGMELTGPVSEPVDEGLAKLQPKELVPPEHKNGAKERTTEMPHASDIWQLGKLIESLIQQELLEVPQGSLPLDAMIHPDPRKRPTGDVILEAPIFASNTTVQLVRFARLKGLDKAQNAAWADRIVPTMHQLPQQIVENFILPQLLTQEFFAAEGFDTLYRILFTPQPAQPLVSEDVYRSEVLPFMVKLWKYRQADIRLTIFRLFEVYLKAVVLGEGGSEVLGQIILPEIMLGLQDTDPRIYLASLSGLATTVPYALLVQTSLVDMDTSKHKYSVKSLYEQTLIPHIMAFWISTDSNPQSRSFLLDVVVNMWSSIYSLGLQGQPAVKDISATLTVTLVSLLKLSPVSERVDHIQTSFTNHCTSGPFCISGLLKFLPQLLLDEDVLVREAAAAAIASVAQQTVMLAGQMEPATSSQGTDGSGSASASPNTHTTRIRQYCEKQQALLPTRRAIFSRSISSLSDRNLSRDSSGRTTPKPHDTLTELSSRRSSMVSQDSFFISDPAYSKSPVPSRSNTLFAETLNGGVVNGNVNRSSPDSSANGSERATPTSTEKSKIVPSTDATATKVAVASASLPPPVADEELDEPHQQADDEQELMRALEQAKAEMKMHQLATEQQLNKSSLPKPAISVATPAASGTLKTPSSSLSFATKNMNDAGADDSWGFDDNDNDDAWGDADGTMESTGTLQPSAEDEAKKRERERAHAERQEALRLKREQKQQELQAKREARKQQMAQKQMQKKSANSTASTSKVSRLDTSALSSINGGSAKTSRSNSIVSSMAAEDLTSVRSPSPSLSVSSTMTSGVNNNQTPKVTTSAEVPSAKTSRQAKSLFALEADNDGWGMEDEFDLGFSATKADDKINSKAKKADEDDLFKDLQVEYKRPLYVGPPSIASSSSSLTSNKPLSGGRVSPSLISSDKASRQPPSPVIKPATQRVGGTTPTLPPVSHGSNGSAFSKQSPSTSSPPTSSKSPVQNHAKDGETVSANKPPLSLTPSLAPVDDGPSSASSLLAVQVDSTADDGWGDDWE